MYIYAKLQRQPFSTKDVQYVKSLFIRNYLNTFDSHASSIQNMHEDISLLNQIMYRDLYSSRSFVVRILPCISAIPKCCCLYYSTSKSNKVACRQIVSGKFR